MSRGLFASLYEAGRPFALIDTRERRDHVDGHWFGSSGGRTDAHVGLALADGADAAAAGRQHRISVK